MSWDLSGGVAVVTGAASGIGRALAVRLAAEKMALALCDVDGAALAESASAARAQTRGAVTTHLVDVGDAGRVQEFAAETLAAHGRATLLVNNAGVALHGNFDEISTADIEWLMRVNFWGVVHGTKAFLPILRKEPRAHIVNVSSVFGIIAPAGQTAYAASKFAVRGLTEALRHEMEGSNVGVSGVYPGGVRTKIAARARLGERVKGSSEAMVARFEQLARNSPEFAARKIVAGIKRNQPRILVGVDAHAIAAVQRVFPARYWSLIGRGGKRT